MQRSASITIDAPPDAVYAFLSDVTRLGTLSPECHACEWSERKDGGVGSSFLGHNRNGPMEWTTVCHVVAAEPDREFAFEAGGPEEKYTRWRYRLEPAGSGTAVTESFEIITIPPPLRAASPERIEGRCDMLEHAMQETLQRLKTAVEAGG